MSGPDAMRRLSAPSSEAASCPRRLLEMGDFPERCVHDGHDHHLREPVERLQRERLGPAIPAAHHQLALVIRIDEAHQVAEHDPVLVPQPGPGKDQRREPGIADVDRDPGRDQRRFSGRKRQRRVDARPQVEARGTGGRVRGQVRATRSSRTRNAISAAGSAIESAPGKSLRDFADQPPREVELVHPGQAMRAGGVE